MISNDDLQCSLYLSCSALSCFLWIRIPVISSFMQTRSLPSFIRLRIHEVHKKGQANSNPMPNASFTCHSYAETPLLCHTNQMLKEFNIVVLSHQNICLFSFLLLLLLSLLPHLPSSPAPDITNLAKFRSVSIHHHAGTVASASYHFHCLPHHCAC